MAIPVGRSVTQAARALAGGRSDLFNEALSEMGRRSWVARQLRDTVGARTIKPPRPEPKVRRKVRAVEPFKDELGLFKSEAYLQGFMEKWALSMPGMMPWGHLAARSLRTAGGGNVARIKKNISDLMMRRLARREPAAYDDTVSGLRNSPETARSWRGRADRISNRLARNMPGVGPAGGYRFARPEPAETAAMEM